MNLPNALTVSRIILAPVFFLLVYIPIWVGSGFLPCYLLLWLVFLYIEISDIFDGRLARSMGLVSELGKLLDPFSDVISRLTYFVAFTALGIMPAWMFVLILYRELGITFLRSILFNRGIAMGARKGGKLKAVLYALAGGAGLLVLGAQSLGFTDQYLSGARILALVLFGFSVLVSLVSFVDYIVVFIRLYRKSNSLDGSGTTAEIPADAEKK